MAGCSDLQTCAELLKSMLEANLEGNRRNRKQSKADKLRPKTDKSGLFFKRKYRKFNTSKRRIQRPCMKIDEDTSLERDIQRVILVKRQLMQAPTLNAPAWTIDEPPERDAPNLNGPDESSVCAPYNGRLTTSTPQRSPVRIVGKTEISLTDGAKLQGTVDNHAMNSYEYLKDTNQGLRSASMPKLTKGDVQFQASPTKGSEQRYAFSRQMYDAMQGVYIDNLKESLPKSSVPTHQYSMYSDADDLSQEKPCRDTSGKPAKELRPPISPFKYSQGENEMQTKSSLDQYNKLTKESATFPTSELLVGEPTKETMQFVPQASADISHLSREQLIQAALKVALESGALDGIPAYMKTGPISPFRPGSKGFSAYGRTRAKEPFDQQSELEQSTLLEDSLVQANMQEADPNHLGKTYPQYNKPHLRGSVADLHIPDVPAKSKAPKKTISAARIDALAAPKKQKNKKTQFTQDAKKKSESNGKGKKIIKRNGKVVSKQSIAIQANASKSLEVGRGNTDQTMQSKLNSLKSSSDVGIQTGVRQGGILKKPKEILPVSEGTKENVASTENEDENKENDGMKVTPKVEAIDDLIVQKRSFGVEMAEVNENIRSDYEVPVLDQNKYNSLFVQIKHLTKELKSVPGLKLDKEGKRLLKELDEKVNKGKLDLQTDLDIAVQPLRSENAQLRRRVRILTQQLKDKEAKLQNAEKPDPNFMVVHLQMQNYNLDNELKATKQVVAKLKEEVSMYQKELDRVSGDRQELLNLMGKGEDGVLSSKLLRENKTLKAQIGTLDLRHTDIERQKQDIEAKVQMMNITCKQKDQELENMQKLVHTLQASMKRLLQEMQTGSRESFMSSISDVKMPSQRIGKTDERINFTSKEVPSNYQPFSRNSAAHGRIDRNFEEKSTDARFTELPKENKPRSENVDVANYDQGAKGYADHNAFDSKNIVEKNQGVVPKVSTMSTAHIEEQGRKHLIDQPGLNYSKIAESLNDPKNKRRSLSTNPETVITEYRQYPGMSPVQETSAFDKLDPFIKDLLKSQRLRNQDVPHSTLSGTQHQTNAAVTSASITLTPSLTTMAESETKESTSTGPTVKELLTPLADRMQRIQTTINETERSRAVRAINFDTAPDPPLTYPNSKESEEVLAERPLEAPLIKPTGDVSDDSYTKDLKKDIENLHYEDSSSTLFTNDTSSEQVIPAQPNITTGHDSRYSVTDYFSKYPDAASKSICKNVKKRLSHCTEETKEDAESGYPHGSELTNRWTVQSKSRDKVSRNERNERIGRWAEQVVYSQAEAPFDDSSPEQLSPVVSPQVKLYRGTDLDTSLSTINDRESVITSNSVTTTGSLSSVDDRIFRQGLANLDANIERVQKSLREAML